MGERHIVIAGQSGVGKSVVAAAQLEERYRKLVDSPAAFA